MEDTVRQFIQKTGCDEKTAKSHLILHHWYLPLAIDKWENTDKAERAVMLEIAPKRRRGISEAPGNENVVYNVRKDLATSILSARSTSDNNFFVIPAINYSLPNDRALGLPVQGLVRKQLIDNDVKKELESLRLLNWWSYYIDPITRLWPMQTVGDGNCLLHAVSLSIFGLNDRFITLRNALNVFMSETNPAIESIKRRWRWHESVIHLWSNEKPTEEEWETDWQSIIDATKSTWHADGYRGLEAIHILCLAHMLRRVIIVFADPHSSDITPTYFYGVNIPFVYEEGICSKNPIIIGYHKGHFSGFVFMETDNIQLPFFIPINDCNGALLPIAFQVDPGADFNWEKLPEVKNELEDEARDSACELVRLYLDIVDPSSYFFKDGPYPDTKRDEYADMANNNTCQESNNLDNQTLTNLSAPKKQKTSSLIETVRQCVKITIKNEPFQIEMNRNYIRFAMESALELENSPGVSVSENSPDVLVPENSPGVSVSENSPDGLISEYSPSVSLYANSPGVSIYEVSPNSIDEEDEQLVGCINNCGYYGTETTSYLCVTCFEDQKEELKLLQDNTPPFVAAEKSQFYGDTDLARYVAAKNLPKGFLQVNNTVYVPNSTFIYDINWPVKPNINKLDNENLKVVVEYNNNFTAENEVPSQNGDTGAQIPKNCDTVL